MLFIVPFTREYNKKTGGTICSTFIKQRKNVIILEQNKTEEFARIHSIESFGTVDGPGIRFVIFMQGCHLHCKYCHNRDTWKEQGGNQMTVSQVMHSILRYKNYILPSGGGVTVTGGEPLLQVKFLLSLFAELKKEGIPTAIDTSGMVDLTEDIKTLLSLTDLVLLDIKHIDSEKCKNLVGCSNEKELAFANYLSDNHIPIWIRQVLVPGITDDPEDLLKLKKFITTLSSVEKVEILPYHSMGEFKWNQMGLSYPLEGVPNATKEDVQKAKQILGI